MGKQVSSEATATNIRDFRTGYATVEDDPSIRPPSFLERRLYEAGVLDMVVPSTKPPGFFVNWTTVTSLIVVVSAIVGLWYFTWQAAQQAGFERGKQEAERQQLMERLTKSEEELRRVKDLKLVQSGQNAGHEKEK